MTDQFRVLQCDESSLHVALNETLAVEVGDVVLQIPQDPTTVCDDCAYIARRVVMVTAVDSRAPECRAEENCLMLSTVDALFEDVYDQAFLGRFQIANRAEDSLQDIFGCPARDISRLQLPTISSRQVSAIPTSCEEWQTLNPDGTCPFTNCPGPNISDPSDCFSCRTNCDNGCGSDDFDVPESVLGLYDFAEACCIHDHCYSSTFPKSQCDLAFLRDNLSSCASSLVVLFEIIPIPRVSQGGCALSALIYYSGVALGGGSAHQDAQQDQSEYESDMCLEREEDNIAATVFTDPHLRTFDGLAFDCQATGEFTLVRSEALQVDIQARFSGPDTGGSVTTGIAMREGTFPIVQASIPTMNSTERVEISGCPVSFYLDGESINAAESSSQQQGPVISLGDSVTITLPSNVGVSFRARESSVFGCYLESLTTFIPRRSASSENDFIGLLGKPNGIPEDDWSTENGSTIPLPDDRLFKPAYDYCTQNWCIRNSSSSIFTYEPETAFSTFSGCNIPYSNPPDLGSASPQLVQLCGDETACLIDGIVGDIDDARTALSSLQEADMTFNRASPISFEPPVLAVNEPINVLITVNVNRIRDSVPSNLDSFALYRIDPATGMQGDAPILSLEDNGDPGFSDAGRGDGVYSNLLAFLSTVASESFGFRAIPVFDGVEDPDSQFVSTALTGVRSFSSPNASATPNNGTRTVSLQLGNFRNNSIAVKYSWGADVRDLDTGTEFLDSVVGFGCGIGSVYVTDPGDDTGAAGSETVIIDVIQARIDGFWSAQTAIQMRAGWFAPRGGSGPATLRVFLINKESGNEVEGFGISTVINPGIQNGCADTDVADLNISVEGSLVNITLNSI